MTIQQAAIRQCFYQPADFNIIDFALPGADGILRGGYSGETLEQMRLRYPLAIVGDLDTFIADKEARLRTEPKPITREQWMYALEVLPPMKWRRGRGDTESFMMSELFSGNVTTIYCRIGSQRFEFLDVLSLTHDEIVARCRSKVVDK